MVKKSKSAFTLIELSITVVLIALIALLFSAFDFRSKSIAQKRDTISNGVLDIIRSNRTLSTTGKSFSGTTDIYSDYIITFTTGSVITEYAKISSTWSIISTGWISNEHSIASPMFWDDNNQITYFSGSTIDGNSFCMGLCPTGSTQANKVIISIRNGELRVIPYANGNPIDINNYYVNINIRLGYQDTQALDTIHGRIISIDARTGKIDLLVP